MRPRQRLGLQHPTSFKFARSVKRRHVSGARIRLGRQPGGATNGHTVAAARCRTLDRAARPRHPPRPRTRHHPSRSQAGQCAAGGRRAPAIGSWSRTESGYDCPEGRKPADVSHSQDHRFWSGQAIERRGAAHRRSGADAQRRGDGDAELHRARAGRRASAVGPAADVYSLSAILRNGDRPPRRFAATPLDTVLRVMADVQFRPGNCSQLLRPGDDLPEMPE